MQQDWGIDNTQNVRLNTTCGELVPSHQDRYEVANLAAVRRPPFSLPWKEKTNRPGVKNNRFTRALTAKYLLTALNNA